MPYVPLRRRRNRAGRPLRIDDFPLILAGPLLRRTESTSVTVWVALKERRNVRLTIYEYIDNSGLLPKLEGTKSTVQLGQYLHIVAVTANPAASGSHGSVASLSSGKRYYYNLDFGDGMKLNSENVLKTVDAPNPTHNIGIAYPGLPPGQQGSLPGFVLPPSGFNDLRIIHGSCRKPHGPGLDSLVALDGMIETAIRNTTTTYKRPHQLFLTGDQIYADDVADALLLMLMDVGDTLLGGFAPPGSMTPSPWSEPLPIPREMHSEFFSNNHLLPGRRNEFARILCGFTSDEKNSHLLRLGEFFAMYLMAWSDVFWPPRIEDLPSKNDTSPPEDRSLRRRSGITTREEHDTQLGHLYEFRQTLPKVRRALANVPTFMIFDDHEITDDWNISMDWCRNVYSKPVGKHVVQNGLLAFAVFQAWGNTPDRFEGNMPGKILLDNTSTWILSRCTDESARLEIRNMVGIPNRITDDLRRIRGLIHPVDPVTGVDPLEWHYTIRGPDYEAIVLDSRTWRMFPGGDYDPSILMSESALLRQIPVNPIPVTIVIAPAPVMGYVVIESVQLLLSGLNFNPSPYTYTGSLLRAFHLPTHIDTPFLDSETWRAYSVGIESLFSRLTQRVPLESGKRKGYIIFLSGDVHYGFAARTQFWADQLFRFGSSVPTSSEEHEIIFVQLTSSALRNEAGKLLHGMGYIPDIDDLHTWLASHFPRRRYPTLHQLQDFAELLGQGRGITLPPLKFFGWNRRNRPIRIGTNVAGHIRTPWVVNEHPTLIEAGFLANCLPFIIRTSSLGTVYREHDHNVRPDWSYRIDFIRDQTGFQSSPSVQILPVEVPPAGDRQQALRTYVSNAKNHEEYARNWGAGKEIVGLNDIGEITFRWNRENENERYIYQELWWRLERADNVLLEEPFPLTKYIIPLGFNNPGGRYPKPSW